MAEYTFDTLNDKDFEILVRDLLQKKTGFFVESFKSGRDKGIDLRCLIAKSNEILIVQCKHYLKTGLSGLISKIKLEEAEKAKRLTFTRYILATSLPLSRANKEDIVKAYNGIIKSEADIIGQEDLNNLLAEYPEVEKAHYKLWFSSTNILSRIFLNYIIGRSEWTLDKIKRKASVFVTTENFIESIKILNSKNFLLIKGEPGVGKTTLADAIAYEFVKNEYELIVVNEKVKEAEDCWDPEKKQVIYFDDFLGANYKHLFYDRNSDGALVSFLDRVKASKNKKLILTTRTTVLNQAAAYSEKISSSNIRLGEHEIRISSYNKFERAKILYNHLYFSQLSEEYFDEVRNDKYYNTIINHSNFNPRIINFITNNENLIGVNHKDYSKFILYQLDNPSLIWERAFENQLNDNEKILISTLFSIGDSSPIEILEEAFSKRCEYEVKYHGYKSELNSFNRAVKNLLGGFLNSTIYNSHVHQVTFFNPSIVDFLINYFANNNDVKERVINSAFYFRQLYSRFGNSESGKIQLKRKEKELVKQRLIHGDLKIFPTEIEVIELLRTYLEVFELEETKSEVARILSGFRMGTIRYSNFNFLVTVLENVSKSKDLKDVVVLRWEEWISKLMGTGDDQDSILKVVNLFKVYEIEYSVFISNPANKENIQKVLDNWWEENIDDIITSNEVIGKSTETSEIEGELSYLRSEAKSFNEKLGIESSPSFKDFDNIDSEEKSTQNKVDQDPSEIDESSYKKDEDEFVAESIEDKIDDLFEKQ